ncbi:MAG: DUF6580 family putative transport protein [Chthoniobacteraceae bacterium]
MIAAFVLLFLTVAWRVGFGVSHSNDFGWLHNFAPLSAIALCGAIFLPRRLAFAIPLGALLISDLILNAHYGEPLLSTEMLARYVALGAICAGGLALRRRPSTLLILGGSIAASTLFYVVTNTASWISEPRYAKTIAGWVQALTVGLPGYPPTIFFYRNTFLSDLIFTALFLGCVALSRHRQGIVVTSPRQPAPWT